MAESAPHRGRAAPRGRLGRIAGYLAARFGAGDLVATLLFALAAQAGGAALARPGPLPLGWLGAAGVAAGVLLALYLRVADDLKDWETDRRLAAGGDARFRDRPHVTGAVTEADLRVLKLGVAVGIGLLIARQPRGALLLGGLAFLGAWLSSRWFFLPSIARSLPLAFATHNPLALLFLAFALAVGVGPSATPPALPAARLLLGLYLPIAAWELARKVRTPAEETDYQTWSSVLGWRAAAAIPALLVAASAALLAVAASALGLARACPVVLAAAALAPAAAAVTFLVRPSPLGGRRLRPAVELYSLAAALGLLVFAILERGTVAR